MKKLSDKEIETLNRFDEFYKHICKSKVLEGIDISEDPGELALLKVGAAVVLTLSKSEEKEDYFA